MSKSIAEQIVKNQTEFASVKTSVKNNSEQKMYSYVGYAENQDGDSFSTEYDENVHDYYAIVLNTTFYSSPPASLFAGKWIKISNYIEDVYGSLPPADDCRLGTVAYTTDKQIVFVCVKDGESKRWQETPNNSPASIALKEDSFSFLLDTSIKYLICSSSKSDIDVFLDDAIYWAGRELVIKNMSSSNSVTIYGAIDKSNSHVLGSGGCAIRLLAEPETNTWLILSVYTIAK